jgi:ABC-type polysaccharide/polyol phosphate export permease
MSRNTMLAPAAILLVLCAIGSALTRNSHGAANVLSNVCFFGLGLLLLFFLAVGIATALRALRTRRPQRVN